MKLFVFAIGGTGSRVLKSMIMLCAAGVRPVDANGKPLQDVEIVPIIIDPHKSNADLKRTERLLSAYSMARTPTLTVSSPPRFRASRRWCRAAKCPSTTHSSLTWRQSRTTSFATSSATTP